LRTPKARVGVVAQVADRGPPAARQHVKRVRDLAAAPRHVGLVGERIVEVVERLAERHVGHVVVELARPGEEVGDVGVEPQVALARRPQPEAARRRLVEQHPVDGALDPLAQLRIGRDAAHPRQFAQVEQRQGLARRLLGAAVGKAVERQKQRGDVEPAEARDASRQHGAVALEAGQQVGVERDGPAGPRERQFHPPAHRHHGRAHRHGQHLFVLRRALGRGQADRERAGADSSPATGMAIAVRRPGSSVTDRPPLGSDDASSPEASTVSW
jgi:hypothetical protein